MKHLSALSPAPGRWLAATPVVTGFLCVVWALTFVVQRAGLRESGPLWLAASRGVVGGAVLVPALALRPLLPRREHVLAAALGATNVAGFLGLQVAGLRTVASGAAAALVYTQPLLVLVGARLLLGERATRRRLLGALLGFAGVAVVGARELADGSPAGAGLLLGAAASWAAGTLLLKAARPRRILPLVALQNLYGAIPLVVVALLLEPAPTITPTLVLVVAYVGVLASAAGWLLLALLLRRHDAGAVAASIFAVPLLGAVFGAVLRGETLQASVVLGCVLVGAGVALVGGDGRGKVPHAS